MSVLEARDVSWNPDRKFVGLIKISLPPGLLLIRESFKSILKRAETQELCGPLRFISLEGTTTSLPVCTKDKGQHQLDCLTYFVPSFFFQRQI